MLDHYSIHINFKYFSIINRNNNLNNTLLCYVNLKIHSIVQKSKKLKIM